MFNDNSCEGVELLLVDESEEKVGVVYTAGFIAFQLPMIGPRPPFYDNPRCEPYYTVI